MAKPLWNSVDIQVFFRIKVAKDDFHHFLAHLPNHAFLLDLFKAVHIRKIECEVWIALEEADAHEECLEGVELVHEVVDCLREAKRYVTLLQVIQEGVTVAKTVRMHHHVVRQYHLGPLHELCQRTIDRPHLIHVFKMLQPGEHPAKHLLSDSFPLILPDDPLYSQCRVVLQVLIQRFLVRLPDFTDCTLHTDRLDGEDSADRRKD